MTFDMHVNIATSITRQVYWHQN